MPVKAKIKAIPQISKLTKGLPLLFLLFKMQVLIAVSYRRLVCDLKADVSVAGAYSCFLPSLGVRLESGRVRRRRL